MVKQRNLGREEEEREERESLIPTTKVIEYLEPVMSKELLCKFPDNSAFGFDYTQSSIWSPLVPRTYRNDPSIDLNGDLFTPRKLDKDFGVDDGKEIAKMKLMKKKEKKVFGGSAMKTKAMKKMMVMKKVKMGSGFSPIPAKNGCFGVASKGWNKVLKAASKHFKKTKKKDPTVDVKLSTYLKCSGI